MTKPNHIPAKNPPTQPSVSANSLAFGNEIMGLGFFAEGEAPVFRISHFGDIFFDRFSNSKISKIENQKFSETIFLEKITKN